MSGFGSDIAIFGCRSLTWCNCLRTLLLSISLWISTISKFSQTGADPEFWFGFDGGTDGASPASTVQDQRRRMRQEWGLGMGRKKVFFIFWVLKCIYAAFQKSW